MSYAHLSGGGGGHGGGGHGGHGHGGGHARGRGGGFRGGGPVWFDPGYELLEVRSGAQEGCCDDCSCNCVASGCCPDCVAPGISAARRSRAMSGFGAQRHGWNQGGLAGLPALPAARGARRRYARRRRARGMGDTGDSPCGCQQVDPSDSSVTDAQISAMNACNAKCNAGGGGGTTAGQAQAANTGLLAGAASVIGRIFGTGTQPMMPYQSGPDMTTILLLAALGIGGVYLITKD